MEAKHLLIVIRHDGFISQKTELVEFYEVLLKKEIEVTEIGKFLGLR
jgi:hypothetical protein